MLITFYIMAHFMDEKVIVFQSGSFNIAESISQSLEKQMLNDINFFHLSLCVLWLG